MKAYYLKFFLQFWLIFWPNLVKISVFWPNSVEITTYQPKFWRKSVKISILWSKLVKILNSNHCRSKFHRNFRAGFSKNFMPIFDQIFGQNLVKISWFWPNSAVKKSVTIYFDRICRSKKSVKNVFDQLFGQKFGQNQLCVL